MPFQQESKDPPVLSNHAIIYTNASAVPELSEGQVDLVVTSPPYPMIQMWDTCFSGWNPEIGVTLEKQQGKSAYELMHQALDRVWTECDRLLKPNGFICINIGDATRTLDGQFQLYSNHARISRFFHNLNYDTLPLILWRKSTNAPNKFMGSGMLPAGAYVTLEHEYILIFRKGGKRPFTTEQQKKLRRQSAFFWEERNIWFSDIWNLRGVRQQLQHETGNKSELRKRSAAYPLELPYRLINMYSVMGDTILDPFLGTGTTTIAAVTAARNSIGVEVDPNLRGIIEESILGSKDIGNSIITSRLENHREFVGTREEGKPLKYVNSHHDFPVMTKQEVELQLPHITEIIKTPRGFTTRYGY